MAFGAPDRTADPKTWSRRAGAIHTLEWTIPPVGAGLTGQTDWIDTRGLKNVTFEFIAAPGANSVTFGLQGALSGDANSKPAAADFVGVNSTDELGATAATATLNGAAPRKLLSVPDVHRAVPYWLVSVTANTLAVPLTIRAVAESDD